MVSASKKVQHTTSKGWGLSHGTLYLTCSFHPHPQGRMFLHEPLKANGQTLCLSLSKRANSISSLPVEQVGNRATLPVVAQRRRLVVLHHPVASLNPCQSQSEEEKKNVLCFFFCCCCFSSIETFPQSTVQTLLLTSLRQRLVFLPT